MVGFIACVALVFSILCFYKIHTLKKDKAKEDRGKSRETEDVPDILDQGCKRQMDRIMDMESCSGQKNCLQGSKDRIRHDVWRNRKYDKEGLDRRKQGQYRGF